MSFGTSHIIKQFSLMSTIALLLFLPGCASTEARDPQDPFENINRAVFSFNRKMDKYALKPVAKGYKFITPWQLRSGVTNFFSNMGEVPTLANDTLQGHMSYAANDLGRFCINTTVGIIGVFDVATRVGLERRYNDLGLTLAKWGIKKAPYVMLPLFGPSTVRDALAMYPNYAFFTLWPYIKPISLRNNLFVLDVINLRASLLDSENIMREAAIDPYVFIRDAYLQKRTSLISGDGDLSNQESSLAADPLEDEDFELDQEDETTDTSDETSRTDDVAPDEIPKTDNATLDVEAAATASTNDSATPTVP